MHICTLTTSRGQSIGLMYENGMHQFYLRHSGKLERIQQIVADFSLDHIPTPKLLRCIQMTYPRLVQFNDGSFKLYLRTRGPLGGMTEQKLQLCRNLQIGDDAVEDAIVADNLIEAAASPTRHSFSSVTVQTIDYIYPGKSTPKRVREIIVQVGNWDWFVNVIKALVSQPITGVNTDRAVQAILGSKDVPNCEAMIKAYKKNYGFRIFVSYDLQNFYFQPIESSFTSSSEGFLRCIIS